MSTNIKPLHNFLVIERDAVPEKTTSFGLILTDSTNELPSVATILAIGEGVKSPQLVVSSRILIHKNSGITSEIDGKKVEIVPETEVLAVIK